MLVQSTRYRQSNLKDIEEQILEEARLGAWGSPNGRKMVSGPETEGTMNFFRERESERKSLQCPKDPAWLGENKGRVT